MKFRCILCAQIFFLVCCCSNKYHLNKPIILDKNLKQANEQRDKSKEIKRSPLLFQSGLSADNCDSYTKLKSNSEIVETVNNQLVKSEYLVCDALKILSESKIISNVVDSSSMGKKLYDKLDLRSFPNSLYRIANDHSFTLASLFPTDSIVNKTSVKYETDDWILTMKVVAVVQLNSNAEEDWVVQMADESKSGNYRDYETFVIYDPMSSNFIKAKPYP